MTSVYGVTFIGAREQIYRQIRDQNFLGDEEREYAASKYLATLTLAAISNLFERAHLIKKWLIACAKEVSSTNNPVSWITPMGLPVVQPYRSRSNLDTINTIVQNLRLASESEHVSSMNNIVTCPQVQTTISFPTKFRP
jgi:DNA-directed RNA polymerase